MAAVASSAKRSTSAVRFVQQRKASTAWVSASIPVVAVVLGGIISFYAPVIGALIIPILLSLLAFVNSIWASALLYIAVMLVILIKPSGLFCTATQKKV